MLDTPLLFADTFQVQSAPDHFRLKFSVGPVDEGNIQAFLAVTPDGLKAMSDLFVKVLAQAEAQKGASVN